MSLTKSKSAKLFSAVTGVAVALSLAVGVAVAPASAVTIDDLLAQIAALQAQLAQLQGGSSSSTTVSGSLTKDLSSGMSDAQVKTLQMVLNKSADTMVAATGAGSSGKETSYFGPATKAAVIKFQKKYGITPAAGYVGPKTRAQLNTMTGGTTGSTGGTTPVPTGTGLMVSQAAQPSASLAPTSASRVPFTKVTLTASSDGDVTVNGVTVERSGLAQDAVFAGIVLLDENGIQIGNARTLNSNHQVTVGDPFTIKAGQSKTVTIAGNMASSLTNYAGQVAALSVVGVNSSATVSGSFPITGAMNTINATLSLGSVTSNVSSFDPQASQTKAIGDTGIKFAGIRVTAGSSEALRLWSIRWNQSGSAGNSDLANIKVYVDGTAYDTAVSSDGKYYTALFGTGIVIDKGLSKDIYVQGDIIGSTAAGRKVEFDIYKTTDIYLTGETYQYGITPSAGSGSVDTDGTNNDTTITSGTPWFQGSTFSITAGSATSISKATSVAAQNIAVNVPNQVLGGFQTDIRGEAVSVQQMVFTVSTSTAGIGGLLTSVSLYNENGAVVAGPVDATASTTGTQQTLTFTDTVTIPVGPHTYTLKGKVNSSATNGAVITLSTNPSGAWTNIQGQVSGNAITFSTTGFSLNSMTVKAAQLAITMSSSPVSQNIVASGVGMTFANVQLDASQSGEDIRLASIPLRVDSATGISSCQLFDGSTALNTGSNVPTSYSTGSTANTFSFDNSLVVPKGTVKTLTLKCNLSGGTSSYTWSVNSGDTFTVTGVTSSNSVSGSALTVTTGNAGTMTVASGSLTVASDASTPTYTVVAGGSTGVTAAVLKFRATNEGVNLNKLGLQLTNTASSSAQDLVQVYVYDGSTLVGTATFTGSNTTATTTFSSPVALPKDTDKTLTVKVDLANIGTSQTGTEGHLVAIDYQSAQGTGTQSGTTIEASGSSSSSGVRTFKSYPTVALDTLPSTGVGDGRLLRFKITANASGPVTLYRAKFSLATSTITGVTSINMYGYTDSSYSQPISGQGTGGLVNSSAVAPTATAFTITSQTAPGVVIPAGSTYYFQVQGTVAGVQTGSSVSTTLLGDSAYPSDVLLGSGTSAVNGFVASTTAITVSTYSNFVWSPNATTTSGITANDWTNGYALPGLPSSGVIQNRSN